MLYVGARAFRLAIACGFFCLTTLGVAAELAGEVVSTKGKVFIRADGRQSAGVPKPAKPGDGVYEGDVVNTSSDGSVKILLKDKSIVDVGPSALLKLDKFALNRGADRQADLSMMYGTLRGAVTQKIEGKGRFRLRTPAATMGVRGTEFIVRSEVRNMDEIRHVVLNPDKPLPVAPPPAATQTAAGPAPAAEPPKTEITVLQGRVEVQKPVETPKHSRAPASVPQVVSLTAGTQLVTQQGEKAPLKAVTVDAKQLAALSKDVKVVDNTFKKAVVIDPSAVRDVGLGEAVKAAFGNVVLVPQQAPVVSVADMGVPGTFSVATTFPQRPPTTTVKQATVRIRVVRK